MKTDWFKLRMPLITLLSSLAAVFALMIPALKPNASAVTPQGKGGEVIAKPTPKKPATPRKAPPKRNSPASRQSSCSAQSPTQATGRRHTLNLSGGVSLEMLEIPAGSFCMGSNNGSSDEKPVHEVRISQAFYIGRYVVTQAQWQSVMGNNPSYFKDCGGNCPVEQVAWNDAQDFINKLNEANDGFKYRLPTEAEWEYACRAGSTGDYYGSVDDIGWYDGNSGGKTHAVGGKQPNAFGLYDMSGNVYEWCAEWYDANYYASSPATDPQGPNSGEYRVLRGGSWSYVASRLRSANRDYGYALVYRKDLYGFRVVAMLRT